jgi:hypothetical protein
MANNEVKKYGRVNLLPVETFLAQFTDGNGKEEIRLGFLLGPEIRFLELKSLSKPAQSWLREDILVALGKKEPETDEKISGEGLSFEKQV